MRHVQLNYRAGTPHQWKRMVRRYAFPAFTATLAVAAGLVLGNLGA